MWTMCKILTLAIAGEMIVKNMIFQCKLSRKLFFRKLRNEKVSPQHILADAFCMFICVWTISYNADIDTWGEVQHFKNPKLWKFKS